MKGKAPVVTACAAAAMFAGVLAIEGIWKLTEREAILRAFCDAFFVPGILLTSFGILVRISGEGVFDALSYGVRSLAVLFTPIGKKPMKYREYLEMKARTRRAPRPCILRTGVICLIAACACLGMYFL